MRRASHVLAIPLLALLAGCASVSPIERTIQARQSYTLVLTGLNLAHRNGYLPNEDKRTIEPYRVAAAAALDEMEAAALAGGTNNTFSPFSEAARAFAAALQELVRAQAEADRTRVVVERHRAATRPTVKP